MKSLVLSTMALALAFTFNAGAQTPGRSPHPPSAPFSSTNSAAPTTRATGSSAPMSPSPTSLPSRPTGRTAKATTPSVSLRIIFFWNSRSLATFQGHPLPNFNGENTETFDKFDAKSWNDTVNKLNQVMTDLEKAVANASDAQLAQWAPTIANIATHNAYHIGEIVMVRKEQGVWDASKGVK